MPEIGDSIINCVSVKQQHINNLLLFIVMNTLASLFKQEPIYKLLENYSKTLYI